MSVFPTYPSVEAPRFGLATRQHSQASNIERLSSSIPLSSSVVCSRFSDLGLHNCTYLWQERPLLVPSQKTTWACRAPTDGAVNEDERASDHDIKDGGAMGGFYGAMEALDDLTVLEKGDERLDLEDQMKDMVIDRDTVTAKHGITGASSVE